MKLPVCVKCQVTMSKIAKAGVTVIDTARKPQEPYELWPADIRECPICGIQVTHGYPDKPIFRHNDEGFQEYLDNVPEENRVYNYERGGRRHG